MRAIIKTRLLAAVAIATVASAAFLTTVTPSQAQQVLVAPGAAPYAVAPGNYYLTPGPVWAHPNRCFTDEGYGRFLPCGYSGGTGGN